MFAATPFFRDAFGLSRPGVGAVVTALTLGYALWLLPVGASVDRFGERRTLVIGPVGLSAGAVMVAGPRTYALLLAASFFLGSMYSAAIPGTNKSVYDNVATGRQNLAMRIERVGVTAGSGISVLLVDSTRFDPQSESWPCRTGLSVGWVSTGVRVGDREISPLYHASGERSDMR